MPAHKIIGRHPKDASVTSTKIENMIDDGMIVRHKSGLYKGRIEGITRIKECFTGSTANDYQHRVILSNGAVNISPEEDLEIIGCIESTGSSTSFFCYILQCKDNSYYVGEARYLHYRIREHNGQVKTGRESEYVKKHGFDKLLYFEIHESKEIALTREKEIKSWVQHDSNNLIRKYKEYLVNNFPCWKLELFYKTSSNHDLIAAIKNKQIDGCKDFQPVSPRDWLKKQS